ncbi:MAG: peptidoglycan-binding protein [Robiginitomaculum sp.]
MERRLKRTNKATVRSVASLNAAFDALSTRVGSHDVADLRIHIEELASHLEGNFEKARTEIHKELSGALDNPQIDHVRESLARATTRLTQTELRQAESIQKINEQIIRLATAIDNRVRTETREREALASRLDSRFDAVEEQTAEAIRGIGTQVADFGERINRNTDALMQQTGDRIFEASLENQRELEDFKADMEKRYEGKNREQQDGLAPMHRAVATLSARLATIEQSFTTLSRPQASTAPQPIMAMAAPAQELPPFPGQAPAPAAAPAPQDAFTAPIAAPAPALAPIEIEYTGEAIPFDPAVHLPAPALSQGASALAPFERSAIDFIPLPDEGVNASLAPLSAPISSGAPLSDAVAALHDYDIPVAPLADTSTNPYAAPNAAANPYAAPLGVMDNQSMAAARPGAPQAKKPSLKIPALPAFTPRTLRTAASAAALVAIVGTGAWMAKDRLPGFNKNEGRTLQVAARANPVPTDAERRAPNLQTSAEGVAAPMPQIAITQATGAMSQPEGLTIDPSRPKVSAHATLDAAAKAGDPVAQLQKGLTLLQNGQEQEAAKYIRLAANQGQPAAQYYLGNLYENGQGVSADAEQARKLTQSAAQSGHRIAMYDLALYYIEGKGGVAPDMAIAAQWFSKAAEFGMTDAQYNLAVLFERGTGVKADGGQAYVWYAIAGAQGDQDAAGRAKQLREQLDPTLIARMDNKIAAYKPAAFNEATNGIFRNLPWNETAQSGNSQVAKVQGLLVGLGYDAGIADGAMGPRTGDAIKDFERASGLAETGLISDELVQRLETVTGA